MTTSKRLRAPLPDESASSGEAINPGRRRELALLISGASGGDLVFRFAALVLEHAGLDTLHLVVTRPAQQVLAIELGPGCATATGLRDTLTACTESTTRVFVWDDDDLTAPIASGSRPLLGTVVLPCSAGMAGALANGISRGLAQRAADVALKQHWPLVIGIRETPMSQVLLANLLRLAQAGAYIVPPVPAFYLRPDPTTAMERYVDHYCIRVLDLLGVHLQKTGLRWRE